MHAPTDAGISACTNIWSTYIIKIEILKAEMRIMPSMTMLKDALHNRNRFKHFFHFQNELSYEITKSHRDSSALMIDLWHAFTYEAHLSFLMPKNGQFRFIWLSVPLASATYKSACTSMRGNRVSYYGKIEICANLNIVNPKYKAP